MFWGIAGVATTPSSVRGLIQQKLVMRFAQCLTPTISFGISTQVWTVLSGHVSEWNWRFRVSVWVTWLRMGGKFCDTSRPAETLP